jgi:hypothetical protein
LPTLQSFISGAVTQNAVCGAIKDAVLSAGPSVVISFDGCSIPSSPPELRGKKLGPNELGLKVIVDDVSFSFTANQTAKPKINVTMTLEIDSGIGILGSIDGAVLGSTTVSALPVSIQISNIDPTTSNIIANLFGGSFKTTVENKISQFQGPNGDLTTQLNSAVAPANGILRAGAVIIAGLIQSGKLMPQDKHANDFFFLAADIDPQQNVDIDFQRSGVSAAAPDNCRMGSTGFAIVTAICDTTSSHGTVTFDQLDQMMLFRVTDCSTPCLADDGLSNSWDTPPPRFVAPFLEDTFFQEVPNPPKTATYQVCAQNLFGQSCGPNQSVTLNLTVPPVVVPGPPACGPNSHPYQPCRAVLINPAATQPGSGPQSHQP